MKKIVITGATGMIGSSIAKRASEAGIDVLCIVRKESGRLDNLPKSENIKIVYATQDKYSQIDIAGGYDVFYHLAWDKTSGASRDDVDTQVLNVQYALDAVRLAKRLGCKKFVGAGSQAEYGLTDGPMTPETPCFPSSGYGVAKHAAGLLAKLCSQQLKMQFNWVRILSVFGPLDGAHTLIMYTINELRAGRSPEFTKCEQIWDYLYCDDAAGALLAIGKNGVDGKIYPLGSGRGKKLSNYLESIRNIIAPGMVLQFGKKEYYPHQPMYLCADISGLTADTGWEPEFTFENGINRILQGEAL
jgi:nucleoside-diphosphate-sugar epimerase